MKKYLNVLIFIISANSLLSQGKTDFNMLKKVADTYTESGGKVMRGFSDLDSPISLGIPISLFTYGKIKKDKDAVWNSFESATCQLINGVITTTMKYSFNRPRPFVTYPNDFTKHSVAGSKSFPSGHTSMAFAAATNISLMYPKWYVIAPAFAWASTVGYSRMYLGVHYPSDVLAGMIVGSGSAIIVHYGFKWIRRKIEAKQSQKLEKI